MVLTLKIGVYLLVLGIVAGVNLVLIQINESFELGVLHTVVGKCVSAEA